MAATAVATVRCSTIEQPAPGPTVKSDVLVHHEDKADSGCEFPAWTRVEEGCVSAGEAYFGVQIPGVNPTRGFNVNAVHTSAGPAISLLVAESSPDRSAQIRFDALELVDAFLCEKHQWALVRTNHPKVINLKLPPCEVSVAPKPASADCPEWARYFSEVEGNIVTAVVGAPIMGRAEEELMEVAKSKIDVLLPMSIGYDATATAGDRRPGGSGPWSALISFRAQAKGMDAYGPPTKATTTCGGNYWLKETAERKSTEDDAPAR